MSRDASTADVEPRHRLAYWTDMVCDTYVQLECIPLGETRVIEGEISARRLATLDFTRVSATAQRVCRTPAKIARASEDYFLVSIQSGRCPDSC